MNILVIDTSSDIEFIGLRTADGVFSRYGHPERSHSVDLITTMDSLLGNGKIGIHDIDIFGVGTGPGSFTGIRIAVSTARMMAQVMQRPLVGVATPLLYAVSLMPLATGDDSILVALDARKDRVFGAVYRGHDEAGIPVALVPPGDHHLDTLLENTAGTRIIAAGNGIERFKKIILTPGRDVRVPDVWLDGESACSLVERLWKKNPEQWINPLTTVPNYARKSDAETARGR